MTQSRLNTIVLFILVSYFVLPFCFPVTCLADESIAPERNISVTSGEKESPEWKILWDKARNYTRDEKYRLAVAAYSELFKTKSNIEEANWEYCKVLLKVEDFVMAEKIIGGLLDKDPNNIEYLLVGGRIAAHWNNHEIATKYFGKVFEKKPAGEYSDTALLGLATSLRMQGEIALSFALYEQFILRQPNSKEIIHRLAQDAIKLGKIAKARNLYKRLLEEPEVEDEIILQAAQLFDKPGYESIRNKLWLQYLERHNDYIIFREKLVKYYLEIKKYESALFHLQHLIQIPNANDEFLLQAAVVCQHNLKRPDKALFFYTRYKEKHPENKEINEKIVEIQSMLAKEFLVIVENDGARQLWQDLAAITPNRAAIFVEMTDLLEKKELSKELIEVLTILHHNATFDDTITVRLARQLYLAKEYPQALKYFKAVIKEDNKTKLYYQMRAETEQKLGLELEALGSFKQGLSVDPSDLTLRTKCLELAGKIGDVSSLKTLFEESLHLNHAEMEPFFVLSYLDLLSYNFLFQEYEKIYDWAKRYFKTMPETLTKLALQRSSVLRKEGKKRKAEQLLRQLLVNEALSDEVLFQLIENSVVDKNIASAEVWYQALQDKVTKSEKNFELTPQEAKLLLQRVKILQLQDEFAEAKELITKYVTKAEKAHSAKDLFPMLYRLKIQKCWLSFYKGALQEAEKNCRELLLKGPFDSELLTIYSILPQTLLETKDEHIFHNKILIDGKPILTRMLELAANEIQYGASASAEKRLRLVLKSYPDSAVGNALFAELMSVTGKKDIADQYYYQLEKQFPAEPFFRSKRIELEARRGRFEQGLTLMIEKNGGAENLEELRQKLTEEDKTAELLDLARLLWGHKQQEVALEIYRQLLISPVIEQLRSEFNQKQISYPELTKEGSFWNKMMLVLQSEPEVLAELMEPAFLLENLENEAGKIVSQYYEKFSLEKLIASEYEARQAIYDRNYYYAEQSYEKLLKEDPTEGMIDLANIYGKIGKYRKEAQMYEAMQKSGSIPPELNESIERNTLKISPRNLLDVLYVEKSGRDGNIDIAKTSLGTSFWFTPALDKDIRFLYSHNLFESLEQETSTTSNFFYGNATLEFSKAYELIIGAGTETFNDVSEIGYQYDIRIQGHLDDFVSSYIQFEKCQVYDTIEAIKQQTTFQAIETGLNIETPIGLSLGGDVAHRFYNDGNSQNRFHWYSSYTHFRDLMQFAIRYDYQYLTSDDQSNLVTGGSMPFVANQPHYWSPSSYSENSVSLRFQHDFLGYEHGAKKEMSYYAIDQSIGLEDNEYLSSTTKFDIFLEMSQHFLLKGNFTLSLSDKYEEKGLSISLHYRW